MVFVTTYSNSPTVRVSNSSTVRANRESTGVLDAQGVRRVLVDHVADDRWLSDRARRGGRPQLSTVWTTEHGESDADQVHGGDLPVVPRDPVVGDPAIEVVRQGLGSRLPGAVWGPERATLCSPIGRRSAS